MRRQIKSLLFALFLLCLSLGIGVVGYITIEGYDLLNAFYMSVITLSSVGFTEVEELSPAGRLFTSLYILMNLGILAYAVSVLAAYLFEGKLQSIFKNYMVDREISKLKNHVIICGYGITGKQAANEFLRTGKPFVVLEKDPQVVKKAPNQKGFHILEGDATVDESLKLAGIEKAAVIIITTPSDATNVFITLTARELKPKIKIYSRASFTATEVKLQRAGADRVINTSRQGGSFMAQMVTNPTVIEFLNLLTGESQLGYHMRAIRYQQLKPEFKNKRLEELKISELTGCTVIGVKDDLEGLIPSPQPETLIGKEDTIIVLGNETQLAKMLTHFTEAEY